MIRTALVAVLAATGCSRAPAPTSCADRLHGVWITDAGERWMLLDTGAKLEGYPLFDDSKPPVPTGGVPAPRVIDLRRDGSDLRGDVTRRYMQGATACLAKAPLRITACAPDGLELVLADPAPPIAFDPCTWGTPAPSRRERWHR